MTYFLISAVGENFQYQHNSSLGISVFLGNTSHFIPIQWHFELSIARSPSTFFHHNRPSKESCYSGQSKVIRLKYIPWLRSQNFQSFKQFNIYLNKRYGHFCTSTTKKLECITQRSSHRRRVKFRAFWGYTPG